MELENSRDDLGASSQPQPPGDNYRNVDQRLQPLDEAVREAY